MSIKSYFMQIINKFFDNAKGKNSSNQSNLNNNQVPKNDNDMLNIFDNEKLTKIMMIQVIQLHLKKIQHELEKEYLELREAEIKSTLHTTKHTAIVNKMHAISEDLKTLSTTYNKGTNNLNDLYKEIKTQLKLTSQK